MTGPDRHVDELTQQYLSALRGKIAAETALADAQEALKKAERDYKYADLELTDAIMDDMAGGDR